MDRLAILTALRFGCSEKFLECEPQSAAMLAGRIADLTAEIDALNPDAAPITGSSAELIAGLRAGTAGPLTVVVDVPPVAEDDPA